MYAISPFLDYAIFVLISIGAMTAVTICQRRKGRNDCVMCAGWSLLALVLVPGGFLVEYVGTQEGEFLRKRIAGMAPTYAAELQRMGHAKIDLDTDPNDPEYLAMIERQIQWVKLNENVKDIYTFRKGPNGKNVLIVDSETDYNGNDVIDADIERRTDIGEDWPEANAYLDCAFAGGSCFDDIPYTDFWGTWVSAYEPMYDKDRKVEAVLGVDFPADDWNAKIAGARLGAIGLLAVIVTLALASTSIIAMLRANVRERQGREAALREAKEAADAASKAKSEFLANMSHEIRTPLNGLLGMTELLGGTTLDKQQRDYLTMARQSAESLLHLLNDILDFSKIEAGKLELECIQFCLRDTIERTVQTLSVPAADKNLELACRVAPDLPKYVLGDPTRLSQIVINLVGNAIKFTPAGEVVVNVDRAAADASGRTLEFSVEDTGIGISPDKERAIFEAFSQADTATTRRFGGTGLGLAICSQLVRMMGGNISLESELGQGSIFRFTAELPEDATPPAHDRNLAMLSGMRALVVDDNSTNRRIFEEVLRSWKLRPVGVESGREALSELKSGVGEGDPYLLVVLDCMMPDMDGFGFAQQAMSDVELGGCHIVMVSSAGRSEDAARCRELGIARYLTKPVVQSKLLETILDTVAPSVSETLPDGPAGGGSGATSAPLRILLAEDGLVNQKVVTGLLALRGHDVVVAEDGKEAVSAFAKDDFDLVLMDLQMPEMDGFEATAIIREMNRTTDAHTPIIAITAAAMKGDREKCLDAGMDAYIAKPVSANALYAVIDQFTAAPI